MGNVISIRHKGSSAFTIVELLIVIVVIAILAAIILVAYNGVTNKAHITAVSSDLRNVSYVLGQDNVNSGTYPATLSAGNNGQGINSTLTDGTTFIYHYSSSDNSYCVTATNNNISYYLNTSTQTIPTAGACAGDPVNGVTQNLISNSSLESTDISAWGSPNGTPYSRDQTYAHSGSYSMLVTLAATTNSATYGASFVTGVSVPNSTFAANTTYTASAYVYVPSSSQSMYMSIQGPGIASNSNGLAAANDTTKDAWYRISNTFTTSSSGVITIYILNKGTTTAGMKIWIDDVMVTAGSTLAAYSG